MASTRSGPSSQNGLFKEFACVLTSAGDDDHGQSPDKQDKHKRQ